ncbi:MAG TPA: hypothetical protein VFP37_02960 [Steroidobacteraceae bacterium]|nr:hypothetical protein [Steroidobacteraceae bacterium]
MTRIVESTDVFGGTFGADWASETPGGQMNVRIAIAAALMFGSAAQAAEPSAAMASASRGQPAHSATAAPEAPAPLKLAIGDVRKYMMPNEFRAAVEAPDADKTTVIVQGERPPPPLQSEQPQPVGIMALYSLFRHPTSAWRLFVPDMSPYAPPPGPPDVVPPREFRWGP